MTKKDYHEEVESMFDVSVFEGFVVAMAILLGALTLCILFDSDMEEKCTPDYCIKQGETLEQIGVK